MANVMKEVAKILGVELEEEFKIKGFRCKYKLTNDDLMYWSYLESKWGNSCFLKELLTGEVQIVKIPKQILEEKEKEYLSAVIKPKNIINRLRYITKRQSSFGICANMEFISIGLDDEYFSLPYFKKGTMYKGMQLDKKYTLEELGL